jgi:hypothetical protein
MLGGLIPIKSRFILDLGTLLCITNCVLIQGTPSYLHTVLLIIPCVVTFLTAGLLDRWTISLPIAPIFVLQCFRYFHFVSPTSWAALTIKIMSLSMVLLATLLSILFPAVQLGEVKGKYNVGVIDLHLPVKGFEREHVSARILYPCSKNDEDVASVSYLIEETNDQLCAAMMRIAAPPPLRGLHFMLKVWKFAKLPLIRNGKPLDGLNFDTEEQGGGVQEGEEQTQKENGESGKIPMAIYSHGLTGTAVIYSYQTMNLAANGTVVLAIDHTDGSAMGVQHIDGSFHTFDESIGNLSLKGKMLEHILARRKQTDYRTREFLAAAESFLQLNKKNIRELEDAGISFVGKLKTDDLLAMGHSFGAATALTACGRKSEMFSCCISHDPAIDWIPDDVRRDLFNTERVKEIEMKYDGGTCGFETDSKNDSPEKKKPGPFSLFGKVFEDDSDETQNSSVHDLDHFFLYSNEFMDKGWGEFKLIAELSRLDLLGLKSRFSEVGYVYKSHHSEFSDSCSTLPLWLARAVGMTGPRNPIETGAEIAQRTLHFVETIRRERIQKRKSE